MLQIPQLKIEKSKPQSQRSTQRGTARTNPTSQRGTARTPVSVRSNSSSNYCYEEEDEMEMLRAKREMLTQQLWSVMGDLQMCRSRQAGHTSKTIPKPIDNYQAAGRGTINKSNLNQANKHAYMKNRFGTTSQQSWCTETITGMPQLNNTDRRHRRRVTDVSEKKMFVVVFISDLLCCNTVPKLINNIFTLQRKQINLYFYIYSFFSSSR